MSEDTPERIVRRIVRSTAKAALGTLMRQGGAPYVSLVSVATDQAGAPLLLLSRLSDHTKNLEADARVSLLFDATGERSDPLAGERTSLQGTLAPSADPAIRRRYLARHPDAALYAGFADFGFYRLEVERAFLNAGFAKAFWLAGERALIAPAPALAAAEPGIVDHMNDDHGDALQLYAQRLLRLPGDGWAMTGIDPDGIDLRAGARIGRLAFAQRVEDAGAARSELVRLAGVARKASGTGSS